MKLYRVVEFDTYRGEIVPVGKTFYRTRSQAGIKRNRHLRDVGWTEASRVFIQTADVEWVKL